ncbi:MAG: hypothetical protein Q9167_006417 [Letrouitia subvulpina]
MWLIHTQELKLYEITGNTIPPYAILSHTWEEDEISFSEFQKLSLNSPKLHKSKVAYCCQTAASQGHHYVWIDTCCIDKSSSAELSEAINSMYHWYQKAKACYVYLADISIKDTTTLKNSRWFTRGWTLQELLAPHSIIFYDRDWIAIGTKKSLASSLSEAAHISIEHLFDPESASVAAKMSWAARRLTTRTEDVAYCLLGLFNVNMPLLYGEGIKAFQRLQQAILGSSADESIFAWVPKPDWQSVPEESHFGILAPHPYFFLKSGNIVRKRLGFKELGSFYFTNGRLEMTLRARKHQNHHDDCKNCERWEIPLACTESSDTNKPLRLLLHRIGDTVLASRYWESHNDIDYFDDVSETKVESIFDTVTTVRFHVALEPLIYQPTLDLFNVTTDIPSFNEDHCYSLRVSFTQSARKAFPLAAYLLNNAKWMNTPDSIVLQAASMIFGRETGPAFTIEKSFVDHLLSYGRDYLLSYGGDPVKIFQTRSLKYLLAGANKEDCHKELLVTFRQPSDFFSKRVGHHQHLTITTILDSFRVTDEIWPFDRRTRLHLMVDVTKFDVSNVI